MYRNSYLLGLLVSLWTASTVVAGPAVITEDWQLVVGSDPLEMTAAEVVRDELWTHQGVQLKPVQADGTQDSSRPAIIIGTVETSDAIGEANQREPFAIDVETPESFHVQRRGERIYVVGASPKGAMNGAFRLLDRNSLDVADLDMVGVPNFRYRVAGHKMNQAPPPDWSEEDQARYYARHYINVVWGEKKKPPMSYEARKKFGLGLMAELRIPSAASDEWWNDPANQEAIYYHSTDSNRRTISPFSPAGRQWYRDGYRQLLDENPDIKVLYGIFGDYNIIPNEKSVRASDGEPHGHDREKTMVEILGIMREAIGDRDIVPRAWLWHAFYGRRQEEIAFMQQLDGLGYGVMYNEAGNNDDWIFKLDNFDDMATRTDDSGKSVLGREYISLVSAGGACESTNPVIGMPLPRVAAYKIAKLAKTGVQDFALWWGSGEGWTYQPNLEVIAELTWDGQPARYADTAYASATPLLRRIAVRDFGEDLADDVLAYWKAFDTALVTNHPLYQPPAREAMGDPQRDGLRIYDWYQRMGTYTEPVFGGAYPEPVTAPVLATTRRFRMLAGWGGREYTVTNYDAVLGKLANAQKQLAQIIAKADEGPAKEKLTQMWQWSELYRLLLQTQADHLEGLYIMSRHAEDPADSAAVREAVEPLTREAIVHTEALIRHLQHFPENVNLTLPQEGVIQNQGSREQEIEALRGKIDAMKIWLQGMTNLAEDKPVEASSYDTSKPDRQPKYVNDGDSATLWASQFSDDQWIQIDLGAPTAVEFATLDWKTAYAAEYRVQVATQISHGWRTVYRTDRGHDGLARVQFPEGTVARFIRVEGIKRGSPYGYALREIQVFGAQPK